MARVPYPVPNSTTPFWRTDLDSLDTHRTTPTLPAECDTVIIGAGFSGAAIAHYIYESNPSRSSVLILEARQACSGATGRNGGHVKPDLYFGAPKYVQKYGFRAAAQLAEFEAANVQAVKEIVEREEIDCDFVLTRACDAILDESIARDAELGLREMKRLGLSTLNDVHFTPKKHAERVSGVKGAVACFTYTAGHLWPYKLTMHLLRGVLSKGANLQTHTPVIHVSDSPQQDGRWAVTTSRGVVRAKRVIFATNAYTSSLAPQFQDHIVPVKGTCSRIVVPRGRSSPHLPNTYGLRYGPSMYDYLIPRNDGSIIVGGARAPYQRDLFKWFNVSDDSQQIDSAKEYFDGLMQRHFRGWEDSGAYTDRVWTGILGYSNDLMPFVGHIPGKPGQMVMASFNGHGMPQILLSAKGLVKMLQNDTPFAETGIPSVFEVTAERLRDTSNEVLALHQQHFSRSKL